MPDEFLYSCWRTVLPLGLTLLSGVVFTLTFYITSRWLRLLLFAITLYLGSQSVRQGTIDFGLFRSLSAGWAQFVINQMLHSISIFFTESLYAQRSNRQQVNIAKDAMTWRGKALSVLKLWNNPRRLPVRGSPGTTSGVAGLRIQSRYVIFYATNIAKLALLWYLNTYLLPIPFSETIYQLDTEDLHPRKQQFFRRLSEVTSREILVRLYVAVYWIWEDFVLFDTVHTGLAFMFVTVGYDSPEEWPPLFGSPTRATGLRRFWSDFWHQLVVPTYRAFGEAIAGALGLKAGSRLSNVVVAMTVFVVSGLAHGVVSYMYDQPGWRMTIWWFCLNFAACLVETLAVDLTRFVARQLGLSRELDYVANSWVGYCIAYTYVLLFLFWSVPKWKYTDLYALALQVESWNAAYVDF